MGNNIDKMRIMKKGSELGIKDITLYKDDIYLSFMFAGNLDLYWVLENYSDYSNEEIRTESFIITKENYAVYLLFEELYNNIKAINIFDDDYILDNNKKYNSVEEYFNDKQKEEDKYRKNNFSNYNELFNDKKNTITWYSDETNHVCSNILKIIKEEETFRIEFKTQKYVDGYEKENNEIGYTSIRFRNSGSRYEPFNTIFMKMFSKMQKVDDILDENHQIHIEEYIYSKNHSQKKLKKDKRINK